MDTRQTMDTAVTQLVFPRTRIAAWLVDSVVTLGLGIVFGGLGWLAGTGYWLLRDGLFNGQSIGKRLMRMRVVVAPDGHPCTFGESAVRNVLWVIPVMNAVTALTGLYYLVHDPQGQHWGDRLARSTVVVDAMEYGKIIHSHDG